MLGWIVGLNLVGLVSHTYEWVFITLNVISIFFGFYFTYLHKLKKNCDHSHCHKTNKRVYWIATILSITMMIFL
jgi:uncharacterized membrane protein